MLIPKYIHNEQLEIPHKNIYERYVPYLFQYL